MFKTRIRSLLICCINALGSYGQCDCNVIIDNSQTSYMINTGDYACVDQSITFTGQIILNGGTLCNYGSMTLNSFLFNSGVINNYEFIAIKGNFNPMGEAVINNYNKMEIENLHNSATLNLFQGSFLYTRNLENNVRGIIKGPESIEGDLNKYSTIFIGEVSENRGGLQRYINFIDLSYVGSSEYRIDNAYESFPLIDVPSVKFNLPLGDTGPRGPALCPYFIDINPNSNLTICSGASATFNATLLYQTTVFIVILGAPSPFTWNPSPPQSSGTPGGTNNSSFTVGGASSSYAITASTFYGGCSVTSPPIVVTLKNLIANAGPSKFIPYGGQTSIGNMAGSSCAVATGGSAPYTYLWTPPTSFVLPSTPTSCNPIVNPAVTTVYQVAVTDANSGCTATSTMAVIVEPFPHAVLKRNLDGGYYKVITNNTLYFKYDEEYKGNSPLSYKIYKQDHAISASAISCAVLTPSYGDNRFALNLSSGCTPALSANQYYVLEVLNEKNEKFYLKFYY